MKKSILSTVSVMLAILSLLCLASCSEKANDDGIWDNATYKTDTTVGDGEKTVYLTIEVGEKSIVLTLKTDKSMLGEAMYEENLINDPSFFNILNGIEAIWEKGNYYWAFYKGDEMMMVGVNMTEIEDGESYRFVYSK